MTRLTGVQAAQLGMGTWRERYPPVIASPESRHEAPGALTAG